MAGKFKIFCDDCSQLPPAKDLAAGAPAEAGHQRQTLNEPPLGKLDTANHHSDNHNNGEREKPTGLRPHSQQVNHAGSGSAMGLLAGVVGGLKAGPPLKREPLGLRQQLTQLAPKQQAEPQHNNVGPTSSIAASSTMSEEDQENDISMASLGSDFVPSITHDEEFDRSFEDEDEEEEEEEEATSDASLVLATHNRATENNDYSYIEDDELNVDDDEELQMELSQAFRQHDESQLYKSVVYNNDIHIYLLELERNSEFRPIANYLDFQRELDSDKRAILINWLVEVSDEYNLQTETLFICSTLIDRFLSKISVPTSKFQLLGVAAMFIASKYEEIYPPDLHQFVEVTDETYSGRQILQMEQEILKTLNFRISSPTISFFLTQIFAFNKFTKKVYHLAEYLCHLSLLFDQPFLEYYPSEIALASVILAANQLDMASSISTDLKIAYDKSNINQLQRRANKEMPFCIESLREVQELAQTKSTKIPTDTAIVHKFSSDSYDNVASIRPPKVDDLLAY